METIQGKVRNTSTRPEQYGGVYLSLRLLQHDSSGNPLDNLISVEMVVMPSSAAIVENDEVKIEGRFKKGTFRASHLVNLKTGAEVDSVYRTYGNFFKRLFSGGRK